MPAWTPPKTAEELVERIAEKLAAPEPAPEDRLAGKGFVNQHNGPRKFPTYAHFPGTGPAGYHCRDCEHVRARRAAHRAVAVCAKAKQLNASLKLTPIDGWAESCKYFQIRAGKVRDE